MMQPMMGQPMMGQPMMRPPFTGLAGAAPGAAAPGAPVKEPHTVRALSDLSINMELMSSCVLYVCSRHMKFCVSNFLSFLQVLQVRAPRSQRTLWQNSTSRTSYNAQVEAQNNACLFSSCCDGLCMVVAVLLLSFR